MEDRRATKSKYTIDRQIPGAFEGETVTRRRFMSGAANVAGAVAVSAIALPAVGFALGPVFEKQKQPWNAVGAPDEFPTDTYIPKVVTTVSGIGQAGRTTVYVRRRNAQVDTEPEDEFNQWLSRQKPVEPQPGTPSGAVTGAPSTGESSAAGGT